MHGPQVGASAITVLQWVNWADQDYVAARELLLSGSLVQGVVFSNTAVEKYLKAIQAVQGVHVQRGHDPMRLYTSCKSRGALPPVNEDFLAALNKAYALRYPDALKDGFNIVLVQIKLLAELDATVHALRAPFRFQSNSQTTVRMRLELLLEKSDHRLTERNSAFTDYSRVSLFAGLSECYELRMLSGGTIIEALYTARVTDDGVFDVEALKPGT